MHIRLYESYQPEEIREFILNIPSIEQELKIHYLTSSEEKAEDAQPRRPHLKKTPQQALYHLPKHIRKITFTGEYEFGNYLPTRYSTSATGYMINRKLPSQIASLPPSIQSLAIEYTLGSIRKVHFPVFINSLIDAVKVIPATVHHLDLSGADLRGAQDSIEELFANIPTTIKSLEIRPAYLYFLSEELCTKFRYNKLVINNNALGIFPEIDSQKIFSNLACQRHLTILELKNQQLYKMSALTLAKQIGSLPSSITDLDLSENQLYRFDEVELHTLFSALPRNLKTLKINSNGFKPNTLERLIHVLDGLPDTLTELDLSNNSLFIASPQQIITLFKSIPRHIRKINVHEPQINLDVALRPELFKSLPENLGELSFSHGTLCGLTPTNLMSWLARLPQHITRLNLGYSKLHERNESDLIEIFSRMPSRVTHLILAGNNLACVDFDTLKRAFSHLPSHITSLDIADNGIDRLSHNKLQQFLQLLPSGQIVFGFETKKLVHQNNGTLTLKATSHPLATRPLMHQKMLANSTLFTRQFFNKLGSLPFYLVSTYLFDETESTIQMIRKITTLSLISSTLPRELTPDLQKQSRDLAWDRISILNEDQRHLDLSRCGLNRLSSKLYKELFASIPTSISSLNLRGNGFQYRPDTLAIFSEALAYLPRHILCVDLSDHGFERYNAEQLQQLFQNLSPTVQRVALAQENPISPHHQIAKRKTPQSYKTLTASHQDLLEKAKALLNDYTKNDSAWWRFTFFHWNRHHTQQIAHLVRQITYGHITDIADLFNELEQIQLTNESGSLARRFFHLLNETYTPLQIETNNDTNEPTEMMELSTKPNSIA